MGWLFFKISNSIVMRSWWSFVRSYHYREKRRMQSIFCSPSPKISKAQILFLTLHIILVDSRTFLCCSILIYLVFCYVCIFVAKLFIISLLLLFKLFNWFNALFYDFIILLFQFGLFLSFQIALRILKICFFFCYVLNLENYIICRFF